MSDLIRDVKDSDFEFFRYLRATESEMGEKDRAAVEQTKIRRKYIYKAYDTTCLIENDEELQENSIRKPWAFLSGLQNSST